MLSQGDRAVLVMSGGGAKGAWQAAAEHELRLEAGLEWTAVVGVSVGGLNGLAVAQGRQEALKRQWLELDESEVHSKGFAPWRWTRLAMGWGRGRFDNTPLRETIREHVRAKPELEVPLSVGLVSGSGTYRESQYMARTPWNAEEQEDVAHAVWASATMPLVWEPVTLKDGTEVVDGGVRNITPLGSAIDLARQTDADGIVVLTTRTKPNLEPFGGKLPGDAAGVAGWVLETLLDEAFTSDLEMFLDRNYMARQADGEVPSRDGEGWWRYVPAVVMHPSDDLGDGLDFGTERIHERWMLGLRDARERAEVLKDFWRRG